MFDTKYDLVNVGALSDKKKFDEKINLKNNATLTTILLISKYLLNFIP